uniref:Putative host-nuclease inhibitor protein n=1 Tax=viral metagenome TaxID=1070528 RepID=A0A6H1ZX60_9ZZZZ
MNLEKNLKIIKDAKLDIELLRRENAKQCRDNDFKIGELNVTIGVTEKLLEEELKESGEKKLECKLGWCAYRVMPDKWEYDDDKIIEYCKSNNKPYYHTVDIAERMKLKTAILTHQEEYIPGVTVTSQEPKFNYKIKGGL